MGPRVDEGHADVAERFLRNTAAPIVTITPAAMVSQIHQAIPPL